MAKSENSSTANGWSDLDSGTKPHQLHCHRRLLRAAWSSALTLTCAVTSPGSNAVLAQTQDRTQDQSQVTGQNKSQDQTPSKSPGADSSKSPGPDSSKSPGPGTRISLPPSEFKKQSPDLSKTALVIYDADTDDSKIYCQIANQATRQVQYIYGKVENLQWLGDNATVVYLAKAHFGSPVHLFSTNLNAGLTRDLTPFASRNAKAFYTNETGAEAFVLLNIEDKTSYDLYQISTATGALQKIGKPPEPMPEHTIYAPAPTTTASARAAARAAATALARASAAAMAAAAADKTFGSAKTPLFGQEELVQKYKGRIQQFVIFCPDEGAGEPPKMGERKLKPWKPEEIGKIKEAVDALGARAPGLILQAAHGQRIQLFRTARLSNNHFTESIKHAEGAAAVTIGTTIIFADSFFAQPKAILALGLAHELTHAADFEARLSHSTEWSQLVGRNVALMHQAAMLNHSARLPLFDDTVAKYYQLPSAYAGSNLNEALADSVCHYINGDHAPPPLVLDFIRKYILSEPNTPTDNAAKLKSAKDLTSTHQCTEAIVLLNEIIKSEPQYIAAYYFRADAYERLAKHEESLHDLDHCLALLKILDLPAGDGYYFNCFCARVEVLTCLGRRKEALEALASAQAPLSNPINATARKRILSGRTPFGTEKSATGKHSN